MSLAASATSTSMLLCLPPFLFDQATRWEMPPLRLHALDLEALRNHIEFFSGVVREGVVHAIPDRQAFDGIVSNVPLFRCPDPDVERTYYYR